VDILKEKTGLAKKDIELFLGSFVESVKEEVLVKGNDIRLRDLGTFKQKKSAPRTGRNPRTGEDIQIAGSTSVSFSVSSALKIKDEDGGANKPASKKK
jgi:DNA-binding protein HU-beta